MQKAPKDIHVICSGLFHGNEVDKYWSLLTDGYSKMNLFNYKKTSKPAAPDTHERTQQDEVNEHEAFELREQLNKLKDDKYLKSKVERLEREAADRATTNSG